VSSGPRWVSVEPERIDGWLHRFAQRHGSVTLVADDACVTVTAADGSVAECHVPFPPLRGDLAEHALVERRVGVLLVRLGGHAVGVFEGATLVRSKVGSRQVHGRSAAGGWSQQRFARRRVGQVRVAHQAAADLAAGLLVDEVGSLDAIVTGGDRRALESVLADPRLTALRPLVVQRVLDVPDPRLVVLRSTPELFRAVRVKVLDAP
jgi:hypothetical protein